MRINKLVEYKDLGSFAKGVHFQGGLSRANQLLSFQMYSYNKFSVHLRSKHHFCGVIVPQGIEVIIRDTMERHKHGKILQSKMVESKLLAQHMTQKFSSVLSYQLGCVTHYETPYLKFKGEVPLDGGR